MSDEKEKQEEEPKPPKKKLLLLVGVAVGAVLGGAGVVMMSPVHVPEPTPANTVVEVAKEWIPEDLEFDFRFNPQVQRGKSVAHISFKVAFIVQPGKQEEAEESVSRRQSVAWSRCLELLSGQTVRELNSLDGKKHLKRLLIDELTYSLFPASKDDRIATVEDIIWTKFLIQ